MDQVWTNNLYNSMYRIFSDQLTHRYFLTLEFLVFQTDDNRHMQL